MKKAKKDFKDYETSSIKNEDYKEPNKKDKIYTYPAYGISVKAASKEEADKKLKDKIK